MHPDSQMFRSLMRICSAGFNPTGLLDIGAHDGEFSRGARKIFENAHIMMVEALEEKQAVLTAAAAELGNADCVISLLGDREVENVSFFVVDRKVRPELVTTGSSKYRENTDFPMEERRITQRTLRSLLDGSGRQYQFVKLDVQGAELDILTGLGHHLSVVEVILMEMSLVEYNKRSSAHRLCAWRIEQNRLCALRHCRRAPLQWRTVSSRRFIHTSQFQISTATSVLEVR